MALDSEIALPQPSLNSSLFRGRPKITEPYIIRRLFQFSFLTATEILQLLENGILRNNTRCNSVVKKENMKTKVILSNGFIGDKNHL